jgi:hypothetical protein
MNRKPRAYLEKWSFVYGDDNLGSIWYGRDQLGKCVAQGKTRKECEKQCRYKGYVPERRK